ncbi:hypothetical protein Bbelb_094400 [Branchiostoma belcheri]|nr:hypothetical protein Bbelb_094400 [Branchiostoma belcheri]
MRCRRLPKIPEHPTMASERFRTPEAEFRAWPRGGPGGVFAQRPAGVITCGPVGKNNRGPCQETYIGETDRSLKARFQDHTRPSSASSEVSQHIHIESPGHHVSLDTVNRRKTLKDPEDALRQEMLLWKRDDLHLINSEF